MLPNRFDPDCSAASTMVVVDARIEVFCARDVGALAATATVGSMTSALRSGPQIIVAWAIPFGSLEAFPHQG